MQIFGIISFIIVMYYSAYPKKVKHLEANLKRIEKKQKGENAMSKLINELTGKECKIKSDAALELVGSLEIDALVLDADEEWIKIRFTNKKKQTITKLIRIENIEEIEVKEN